MSHAILASSALVLFSATLSAQATLLKVVGDTATGTFGGFTTRVGDIDRDGRVDFIAGLPNARAAIGVARVYSSRDGRMLFEFRGDAKVRSQFGSVVGSAGDVNGDGYPDPIVSGLAHPKNGVVAGYVQVFSGKDGKLIRTHYGDGPGDFFGNGLDGVGDVDGDGVADYMIGAPENGDPVNSYGAGYARLFSGKTGAVLHTFKGVAVADEFGFVVAGAGDVDKDRVPDILVGSTLEDGNGSARLFSGRTKKLIFKFPSVNDGDHFGVCLNPAGDVDGDGYLDVLVGAPNAYSYLKGAVWVFSGRTGKKIHHVVGSATTGMFGRWVQGVGDVNNDGHADFIGGDPMDSTAGRGRGSVRLYSGKNAAQLSVIYADSAGLGLGSILDCLGDVNGDGMPELVCGIPGEKRNGTSVGAVTILSLRSVALIGSGCAARGVVAPTLDLTSPAIGKWTTLFLRGQTRASGMLFMSAVPDLPTSVGRNCHLHLDLASATAVTGFRTDSSGRWSWAVTVPNNNALIGATFALQCGVGATSAPLGTDLTNGVHVVVSR